MIRNNQVGISQRSAGNSGAFARVGLNEAGTDLNNATGRKPLAMYVDFAVGEVMDGPLSRGVANKERRLRADEMLKKAEAEQRTEYKLGMIYGLQLLMDKPSGATWEDLLETAGKKRASKGNRLIWKESLQLLPYLIRDGEDVLDFDTATEEQVDEFNAGQLGVALALSGLDDGYNLDRQSVQHGPSVETEK